MKKIPLVKSAGPIMRLLKIEIAGDFWNGNTKPRIRLAGRWLDQAGFKSGQRVYVICIAPGVIELRATAQGGKSNPMN